MLRMLVWDPIPGKAPRTELVKQTADISPALAIATGDLPIGINDVLQSDRPEVIYLGQTTDTEQWNDVVAIVRDDGIAADLPVNHPATAMARFMGAHVRDIPTEGLRGTVLFAGRRASGMGLSAVTNVSPTTVALAMQGDLRDIDLNDDLLPPQLSVPAGVVIDTPELFQLGRKARLAGCELTLPDWLALYIVGEPKDIYHIVTNHSERIRRTPSGVAYLRCRVMVAIWVEERPKPQPWKGWIDVPLAHYLTLPVPPEWDPNSPQFQLETKDRYDATVTVADLMRGAD